MVSAFILKMGLVAGLVVVAARVAERTRPALAALIATLPFSIGPTYVLLALEHDTAFVSAAALKSLPGAAATVVFIVAYAHATIRFRPLSAVLVAFAAWLPAAILGHLIAWSLSGAMAVAVLSVLVGLYLTQPLLRGSIGSAMTRQWYDLPLRALGVAALVGTVTGFSTILGPSGVGVLANFPVIMSSLGLILHLRNGAAAASGMLAHSVGGMAGVMIALFTVHLTVVPVGAAGALSLGLTICILWNLMLYALSRVQRARPSDFSR